MTRNIRGVKRQQPHDPSRWGNLLRSWLAYGAAPAVGILTAPLLARALGPDGRGELAAILQPLTIASAIAVIGIPAAVTYFVAAGHNTRQVRKVASNLALGSTACVGIVLFLYSATVSSNTGLSRLTLIAIWCAFLPSAFVAIRRAQHQGAGQFAVMDAERFSGALLRGLTITVLFVCAVTSPALFAVAYMLSGLIASGVLLKSVSRASGQNAHNCLPVNVGRLFRFALLASVGTIAAAMNSRLDQALMPTASTTTELGLYSVAVAVAEAPGIVAIVIARNVLTAAGASRGNAENSSNILRIVLAGLVAVTAVCAVIATVMPVAFTPIFGEAFSEAIRVVWILLGATILQYIAESHGAWLVGLNRPALSSLGPLIGITTTVILFAIGWGQLTAIDVAWIALAAQLSSCLLSVAAVSLTILKIRSQSMNAKLN